MDFTDPISSIESQNLNIKQIKPIQYTEEGNLATQLQVTLVYDDLNTSCSFDWKLFDDNGTLVNNGIINCFGNDYLSWSGDNNFPYTFVSNNLSKPITLLN
jgi:hypothetical protein